jgi:hypothetical protein
LHIFVVGTRGLLVSEGRPVPGDTKKTLIPLIKRATTELSWPELPGKTDIVVAGHLRALTIIARLGEPEAAVEILARHVEDIERGLDAPNHLAVYYLYRLSWLLSAAVKVMDKEKSGAYVAEAKGLMEPAIRSLRGLQPHDWDRYVSDSTFSEGSGDGLRC